METNTATAPTTRTIFAQVRFADLKAGDVLTRLEGSARVPGWLVLSSRPGIGCLTRTVQFWNLETGETEIETASSVSRIDIMMEVIED